MYYLLLLIVVLLILVLSIGILTFKKLAMVSLNYDTDSNEYHVTLKWLSPFVTIKVDTFNLSPKLSVFLFKKRIYAKPVQKPMQRKNKIKLNTIDYFQAIKRENSYITLNFGLDDPFATSLVCGLIPWLHCFLSDVDITPVPVFLADHAYIDLNAGTKLNIGKTMFSLFKLKQAKQKRRDEYGAIQFG
jgi:uncharacterized membrane protein YciS (DUF1049 family)